MDPKHKIQKTALRVTRWIGSPQSVALHTILFALSFAAVYGGYIAFERMLLVLTTIVSLEAIYLSIFIQMSINYTTESLQEVEQDIDEIQGDIDEIQEDVGEIQEDVDELQEDVEEMSEEDKEAEAQEKREQARLEEIHEGLKKLMQDVERLQHRP